MFATIVTPHPSAANPQGAAAPGVITAVAGPATGPAAIVPAPHTRQENRPVPTRQNRTTTGRILAIDDDRGLLQNFEMALGTDG